MNVLEARDISVAYGDRVIIEKLSLGVKQGGFVGILGPNGCGKTTLLRTMSRILKPAEGEILVKGKRAESYDSRAYAKILGCVSQETGVAFAFTVRDVVMMGRHPYVGRMSSLSKEDIAAVDRAMEICSVSHLKDRFITEISGGERQRVLIARTLAQNPEILLLDEPTSHLDINHQIDILSMIRSLTPEITVIGVLHDLNIASYFCDTIVLMNHGKIVAAGTPQEVLTRELIREVFSIKMMVSSHPVTGKPYLIPEYGCFSKPDSRKVHVISGGGSGTDVFYSLCMRGISVTAGVLAVNDSDYESARILGLDTVVEEPFAKVSKEAANHAEALAKEADMVVVTPMQVGDGNLANLEILEGMGKKVYFVGDIEDFTGGFASAIKNNLTAAGAVCVENTAELMKKLV
ncbi:MAG TPA: ABC transporter ATP-binding protein [Methanocorpusculum sp.]|nr:ABC transporter ATP-binding protein [Methanocorpusculum sp.]